jgi:hypothetical protein
MDKLNQDIHNREYPGKMLDILTLKKNLKDEDIHMLISACFV